jgi:hypothetical protein
MYMCEMPARRRAGRIMKRGAAGLTITAIVVAAAITGCGTQTGDASHAANHHSRELASRVQPRGAVSRHLRRQEAAAFQTTRTFRLSAGRAARTFTFRERGGVILIDQLTVPRGVRALVSARIPSVAGAEVWSWPARNRPSASCLMDGSFEVCTQGEEWCPMPQAIWHLRLIKLSGPAGPVRFHFVVAPPPHRS